MNNLLETIEIKSINGLFRIYLFSDNNPLPMLKIYKIINEIETPVTSMYGELKKLNTEFSFKIDYEPVGRTKLNTREFGKEFIKRYKDKKKALD
ncbi:hypothetical protein LAV73_03195 [Lysinibacillus xylanilyticus]|uniref:hypothetical protein n=1 Tax=Lysinibacillus TaxID=400634 RepID=UPI002B246102|nr:hypothetical protein [Lysinibacillus xylanilyticus]MEB2279007.1 hypothetical protein [Lysinibacillus xylanilyticus]UNT56863.1 hypothetical protein ICJ70_07540 [Lysinibacillus capsici]